MMNNFLKEKLHLYLPQYLSHTTQREMIEALEQFPDNIQNKLYGTAHLKTTPGTLFQGDCIKSMPIVQAESQSLNGPCILLSNTCDMAPDNVRIAPASICYAPIVKLEKYKKLLASSGTSSTKINNIIVNIRKQLTTTLFFVPAHPNGLDYDGIVTLDRICSISQSPPNYQKLIEKRECSLSQYGHYLLLFKLSIHFTRLGEGFDRDNP